MESMDRDYNGPALELTARNMKEAKEKLFKLYQSDYEIINKRADFHGGFFGFGKYEGVKVTYVVKKRENPIERPVSGYERNLFIENRDEFLQKMAIKSLDPALNTPVEKTNVIDAIAPVLSNVQLSELQKGIEEIKSKLQGQGYGSSDEPPAIQAVEELLAENEFSHAYIKNIVERLKSLSLERLQDENYVHRTVLDWIGESINIAPEKVHRKPHVVIIVGPTGVGKTTTLVKLATQYALNCKSQNKVLNICFITTDTMRVGAQEQLAKYSRLFNLDVLKAERASDVQKTYEDVKDRVDAVFIDTSGYSPNDSVHIGAMRETLDVPGMNPDVYLAVTASTKSRDLVNIMRNYEPFGYNSVIITKCDESEQFGNIVSVIWEKNKSISYVTDGQNAARCIEKANAIYFLIRMMGFKVDRVHIEDKFGVN